LICDKVVCDLGCGDGTFMEALQPYCKEVIGVEIDEILYGKAKSKGLNVICADATKTIPKADIYYSWCRQAEKHINIKAPVLFGDYRKSNYTFVANLKGKVRCIEVNDEYHGKYFCIKIYEK
jgi:16S rRNA A1518/A1519 N6-dimethyltransferase RsmA/KsgA/DIM1 with predicted DNA glycosylase/AP lyase activity